MISCPKLILYKISQLLHPFRSLEESIRIYFPLWLTSLNIGTRKIATESANKRPSFEQIVGQINISPMMKWQKKKRKKGLIKAYFCLINLGSELLYGICMQGESAYYMVVMSRHLQRIISKRLFPLFLALQFLWLRTASRERLEVQSQDMWAL